MGWKFSDQGIGGDSHPAQELDAVVERQHVNDSYGQDSQFSDHPIAEYKFFFSDGNLDVSGAHDLDQLRQRNNVPSDHSGPIAVGNLIVQDGTAIWEVTSNVGLGPLVKAMKKWTKDAGWDWGGITDSKGEPLGDPEKLARKRHHISMKDGHLILGPDGNDGMIDVVGKVAAWSGSDEIEDVLKEFADDFGYALIRKGTKWTEAKESKISLTDISMEGRNRLRQKNSENLDGLQNQTLTSYKTCIGSIPIGIEKTAEYPGGGSAMDYLKNHAPMGEDLELKNIPAEKPENHEKDRDRDPNGIFKCPDCGGLYHRWHEYMTHRREEELSIEPVEDGKFPTIEESVSEVPSYTEAKVSEMRDPAIQKGDRVVIKLPYKNRNNDKTGIVQELNAGVQGRHRVVFDKPDGMFDKGDFHERELQKITMDEDPEWKIAAKQPKDMFTEPVPFIYDVQLDKIFVGHPGARHGEIEAPEGTEFSPNGIVEGEYQPGGKVVVESQSDIAYSIKHMLGLWYWQHREFEITGVMMNMPDGKQRKIADTNDSIGAYIIGQAAQEPAVHAAWQALQKVGGEVYAVGGVVRDALLGKASKDIDLLVTGLPAERVKKTLDKLPGRVDLTGKDFGVFRYNHDNNEVEVALPRTEKSTGERRVDFEVSVDHELPIEQDLERRDFTANAIAVNLKTGEVVDPFNGEEDIKNGDLKTVHPNSFVEDPTRLVRGLVAHSRHGLKPDPKTLREMRAHAPDLANESAERIQAELDKLFSSDNPGNAIRLAHSTGMLKYLLPEVDSAWNFDQNNPHHKHKLGEHLLNVLDHVSGQTDDPDLRMAALLHDIGKPSAEWIDPDTGSSHYYKNDNGEGQNHDEVGAQLAEERLRELKYPTKRIERVRDLITHHMYSDFSSSKGARKFINRVGDHADDLIILREADRAGHGTDEYQNTKTPTQMQRDLIDSVRKAKEPTDRSSLALDGNDLMGLGLQPGPAFSDILNQLTNMVMESPELNDKHTLLNYVRHELISNV